MTPLFVDLQRTGDAHFGEVAHIIAASDAGPRSDHGAAADRRGDWDNLILLCANCHTVIDRGEDDFPEAKILTWKSIRMDQVASGLGILEFSTRAEARFAVEPYLLQNKLAHTLRGPESDLHLDPQGEGPRMWRRTVAEIIIPNHQSVIRIIDRNRGLLSEAEKEVVEIYRTHIKDLVDRHIEGIEDNISLRYPDGMDNLYAE